MAAYRTGRVDRILDQPYSSLDDPDGDQIDFSAASTTRTDAPSTTHEAHASKQGGRASNSPPSSTQRSSSASVADSDDDASPSTQSKSQRSDQRPEPTYEVERVIGHSGKGKKVRYHVKWLDHQEPTWEPASGLKGAADAVAAYHAEARSNAPASATRSHTRSAASSSSAPPPTSTSADSSDDEQSTTPAAMQVLQALLGCSRL
jgi:hypothetical protein